ncbi:MAG: PGF-CTERM sorting domain-containing protein [Candidatus Poseidoniaceae archaeon]
MDGGGSEDTPGFTLVVASAAIAMAVFVNARRDDE